MRYFPCRLTVPVLSVLLLATVTPLLAQALSDTTGVIFKTITGSAEFSTQPGQWQTLQLDSKVGSGAVIRTHADSTVDFYLDESKTTLRLTPNSQLATTTLKTWHAGEQDVTDTQLKLLEGGIVGAQNKLMKPSHFQILTPNVSATIVGTEYVVRSEGSVTVLSGTVAVNYNQPGGKKSGSVAVPAGQSFNPANGTVAPITPACLNSIRADVNTVRNNAAAYKSCEPKFPCQPYKCVSPTHPPDHDHDRDHDKGDGHDKDGDHGKGDDHGGGDDHHGKGDGKNQ